MSIFTPVITKQKNDNVRKFNFLIVLSIISLFFISNLCFAKDELNKLIEKHQGYGLTFLFPINVASTQKINLSVKIPKDFQMITNEDKNNKRKFLQFNQEKTGHMISITSQVGGKYQAQDMMDRLLNSLQNMGATIIRKKYKEYPNYKEAIIVAKLVLQDDKNKENLIYSYIATGPYDSALIQYSITQKSKQGKKADVQYLERLFNENVHIVQ